MARRKNTKEISSYKEEIEKIIDYTKASSEKTFKKKLQKIFSGFWANIVLDGLNSFCTGINATVMILLSLSFMGDSNSSIMLDIWSVIQFVFYVAFLGDYLLHLFIAKERRFFIQSIDSVIEVITILPYFIVKVIMLDFFQSSFDNLEVKIVAVISTLRIVKIDKLTNYIENVINRQLLNIGIIVMTLILTSAMILFTIESEYSGGDGSFAMTFNFSLYFVVTTISTLGYGSPYINSVTRLFCTGLIIVSLLIIPARSAQLVSILSSGSTYARAKYKQVESIPHILITGRISTVSLEDFLHEFFMDDYGKTARHAVILLPHRPTSAMESIINQSNYIGKVFFIQGDPNSEKDLKNAAAEKAKTIVILCNKQSTDQDEEDSKTILLAIVIKKYLQACGASVRINMQILRTEGKTHYFLSNSRLAQSDQVICIEELKLSLLGKSCLCPGLITLITNLINTSEDEKIKEDPGNLWLSEYIKGMGYEIYRTNLSDYFNGQRFSDVANLIYQEMQCILFAVEIRYDNQTKIVLNPGKYEFPKSGKRVGYVIAQDKEDAEKIANYNLEKVGIQHHSSSTVEKFRLKRRALKLEARPEVEKFIDPKEKEEEDLYKSSKADRVVNPFSNEWSYIQQKCYTITTRVSLADATVPTLFNSVLAENHIILSGMVPNLINFVIPLRQRYLRKYPPIVILNPTPPNEKKWNQIAYFPEIYFIKGSAMYSKDLKRANIDKAMRIVILAPSAEEISDFMEYDMKMPKKEGMFSTLTKDEEDLLDAKTIFKYKSIKKVRPNIQIITEVVSPSNICYLFSHPNEYRILETKGSNQSPIYASGQVYLNSIVDALVCQSHFKSSYIDVLDQFLVGSMASEIQFDDYEVQSQLFQIDVPAGFVGQKFSALFGYLTSRQNIILLGIYRKKNSPLPYVMTNPEPSTVLIKGDRIFVLASSLPDSSVIDFWGSPSENLGEAEKALNPVWTSFQVNEEELNNKEFMKESFKKKLREQDMAMNFRIIEETMESIEKIHEEIDMLYKDIEEKEQAVYEKIEEGIANELHSIFLNANEKGILKSSEDQQVRNSEGSSKENSSEQEQSHSEFSSSSDESSSTL